MLGAGAAWKASGEGDAVASRRELILVGAALGAATATILWGLRGFRARGRWQDYFAWVLSVTLPLVAYLASDAIKDRSFAPVGLGLFLGVIAGCVFARASRGLQDR